MKKLHIIHARGLEDVQPKFQGKVLPVLENETLEWAKKYKAEAYNATLEVQKEFIKNPGSVNS